MGGKKNEKKVFMSVLLTCAAFILSSCCSSRGINGDLADAIAGNSRAAGRLEATVAALDGAVADSRKRIADVIETSRDIADGIERIEYLFEQYESEVERILREIDRIRNEAEILEKNKSDSGDSPALGNSGSSSSAIP